MCLKHIIALRGCAFPCPKSCFSVFVKCTSNIRSFNNIKLDYIISKYDTSFDMGVEIELFGILQFSGHVCFYNYFRSRYVKQYFRQSARSKVTALETYSNFMFLPRSGLYDWICCENLDCPPPPFLRFLFIIHSLSRRYNSSVYKRSNTSNIYSYFTKTMQA